MHSIIDKLERSDRISADEALRLARDGDLHELGRLGLKARTARYGRKAFYVYNQHLNYTNVCANACRFCAFSKREGEEGAYAWTPAEVEERIRERLHEPIREVHVVGGLNPKFPYDYYPELIRAVKRARPGVMVKAFTAVEIAYLADTYGKTDEAVLRELMEAGLDALPGGGAEVFSPALRSKLCPEKVSHERWLSVHATAHGLGLPTNATLLFGHVETWEDRIEHMSMLRDLQDRTGGFKCFIPLPYQPGNNPLDAPGPDGVDYLRMMSMARLFLDNIPHLKAYWAFAGIKAAQVALHAGADDFDGTLIEEKVGHAAGASTPKGMTVAELRKTIEMAGFEPVERDSMFDSVR